MLASATTTASGSEVSNPDASGSEQNMRTGGTGSLELVISVVVIICIDLDV